MCSGPGPQLVAPDDASRSADDWFTPGRFLLLLTLGFLAAFPEVVLGSHTFYYRDFGHFAFPLASYHRECFWRGELPLWNPYNSCGLPYLAQWNTMCLYPGALIYLLGPMPWALGGFSLAHLLIAGAGAYQLAHRWTGNRFAASIGGLAFAFNGFTLHAVMWPNNVAALAWAPWLWLLVERACQQGGRTLLLAALAGTMQMLTGAPEIILFTWAIAVLLALGKVFRVPCSMFSRRSESATSAERPGTKTEYCSRFAGLAALVALLSAAQLFPFLDLLRHSHRTLAYDDNLYALPLWGWANFFVPLFRMTPDQLGVFTQPEQQWASSYYPGLGVLALAAFAVWRRREPRVGLLAAVAVLGVWLAMGQPAFLLDWLKAVCPPLGFIRFPVKYVLLPLMVLPFLAAIGVALMRPPARPAEERARHPNDEPRLSWFQPFAVVTLAILATVGAIFLWASRDAGPGAWGAVSRHAPGAVVALLMLGLLLLRPRISPRIRFGPGLAILVLLVSDILWHTSGRHPTVIAQAYEPGAVNFSTTMPRLGEGRAMISREMELFMAHAGNPDALNYCLGSRRALFANWNLLDAVPKVNGFFSQFPRELSDSWWLLYGLDRPFPGRLADFLGITRISSSDVLFTWAQRTNALPLVTAGQQPVFSSATNTLLALAAADFNPRQVVHLPETLRPFVTVTNAATARVLAAHFSAQDIRIEVDAESPAWVVIAQTYYHPWRAFAGGRELPIHRANHAFQALEVPAGRQVIEMRYVDHAFTFGALISMVTLLATGALCWRFGKGPA